jgi:hypothetical protein
MNAKLARLHERRERLIAQAAEQRRTLGRDLESWRIPLALADRGLNAVRYVKSHPQWIIGGVVLLAALRPRRVGKWLGRGLVSWQVVHRLLGR